MQLLSTVRFVSARVGCGNSPVRQLATSSPPIYSNNTPSFGRGRSIFGLILYTGVMPFLTWGLRRQLAVFAIFAAAVLLIVFGAIYYFRPEPSCFDNRQNQDEEGVDCGGEMARCTTCSEQIRDLTTLWTRFFLVREGVVDAAALLENSNQFLGAKKFVYAVKLYDENNVLIAIRENSTFILPGEKFLIFEPNIIIQDRAPKNAVLEMRAVNWEPSEPAPPQIDILEKDIFLADIIVPRLEVAIKNQSRSEIYKNIETSAVLLNKDGDVLGVSRTVVDRLNILEEKTLTFTWPWSIEAVFKAEIFLRQIPK